MARAVGARTSLRYLYYSPARLQYVSGRCVKPSVHLAYLCGSSTTRQSQPNILACKAGPQKSFQEGGTSFLGTDFWRGSAGLGLHRAILGAFLKVGCAGSNTVENRRGFWTSPVMMGRRAAKIATRKVRWLGTQCGRETHEILILLLDSDCFESRAGLSAPSRSSTVEEPC